MWWFENLRLSSTVVEVLRNGYKLPFMQMPNPCLIPNNDSALHEDKIVRRAIEELLTTRCILEVESPPYCCNPLTAVGGNKLHLVIDLSCSVNKYLQSYNYILTSTDYGL